MPPHLLTKTAAFSFLLGALSAFDPVVSFAVNNEHPFNLDHSRANTAASSPSDDNTRDSTPATSSKTGAASSKQSAPDYPVTSPETTHRPATGR